MTDAEKIERLCETLDVFARIYRMNKPLQLPAGTPLRDVIPGVWPTLGDCLKADAVLEEAGWDFEEHR